MNIPPLRKALADGAVVLLRPGGQRLLLPRRRDRSDQLLSRPGRWAQDTLGGLWRAGGGEDGRG